MNRLYIGLCVCIHVCVYACVLVLVFILLGVIWISESVVWYVSLIFCSSHPLLLQTFSCFFFFFWYFIYIYSTPLDNYSTVLRFSVLFFFSLSLYFNLGCFHLKLNDSFLGCAQPTKSPWKIFFISVIVFSFSTFPIDFPLILYLSAYITHLFLHIAYFFHKSSYHINHSYLKVPVC